MAQLTSFKHTVFPWLLAISWTILVIIVLLNPGKGALNHEFTLASFFTSFFSLSISRSDLSEAIAHVILFSVLTVLWQRVLIMYFVLPGALLLAIGIAVMLAIGTEIGQYFVSRGSLLLDLLANFLGIMLSFFWIKRQLSHQ